MVLNFLNGSDDFNVGRKVLSVLESNRERVNRSVLFSNVKPAVWAELDRRWVVQNVRSTKHPAEAARAGKADRRRYPSTVATKINFKESRGMQSFALVETL